MVSCAVLLGCAGPQTVTVAGRDVQVEGRLKDMGDGTCLVVKTGQMWHQDTSKRVKSIEEAQAYVAGLNVGGHDDWRLPTVMELFDLYLLFDLHENGDCQMETKGNFWSDEADNRGRVGSWEMDDNCDPEREYIPKKKGVVRAIRL
ncbi:MAG: DUF1566 domain-containing protein [Thermodesulfobacteriota bacterium]